MQKKKKSFLSSFVIFFSSFPWNLGQLKRVLVWGKATSIPTHSISHQVCSFACDPLIFENNEVLQSFIRKPREHETILKLSLACENIMFLSSYPSAFMSLCSES